MVAVPAVVGMERNHRDFSSDEDDDGGSSSSPSLWSSLSEEEEEEEGEGEDITEETTSSLDGSPPSCCSLYEMSDLMAVLPIKRGLSRHYQGKSQSFTSLASVRCTEDLPKPKRPMKKKLEACRRYGGRLGKPHGSSIGCFSKVITKRPSKGSGSSGRRQGLRTPATPHGPKSFSGRGLLFT